MGYINPLLKLPAGRALLALPPELRAPIEAVLRELRVQANVEAEKSWSKKKGPMAAYWRAVSTYARHLAHALSHAAQKTTVIKDRIMPKTSGTKKHKAQELLARISLGPAFSASPGQDYDPEQAIASYRLWVKTWVLDDLKLLVPELRNSENTTPPPQTASASSV